MTRIVGGVLGGRRLDTPRGGRTRPTTDRVREALFNSLGDLTDLRFLDLYAGSGAVGLEAVSRGAARVTLVEQHAGTAALIRRNAQALNIEDQVDVVTGPVERVVQRRPEQTYHVVFADPPYEVADNAVAEVLNALVGGSWLSEDATVVVERRTGRTSDPGLTWPIGLRGARVRRYGESSLWYGRPS